MTPSNYKKQSEKGVTLTELAVSVAVISLIIAGSFGGVTVIKGAKIRKAVTELNSFITSINEFQSEYGYLPGDLPTASTYWSGAHNGDGNGTVDTTTEDLYAWEHLGKSKLVVGTYTGAISGSRYAAGVNAPSSDPFNTGIFSFYTYQTLVYSTAGHALRLGSLSGGLPTSGVMTAKDAYSIDIKIDDGLAASGKIYTVRATSGCTSADSTASTASYVLSDITNATCSVMYWQKKF